MGLLDYEGYQKIVFEQFEKFTGKDGFDVYHNINDYCNEEDIHTILVNIEEELEKIGIECDLRNYVWYYIDFDDLIIDLTKGASEV